MMVSYLNPTEGAGRKLFGSRSTGPVVMLNLRRFRKIAGYSHYPDLAPKEDISGGAAF